jgi:hypothetical protein
MSIAVYRGMVAVCGTAVAGFAAWFVWSGFVFLRACRLS